MKKISNVIKFMLIVELLFAVTSCEDFLTTSSESQKQVGNTFRTHADLREATAFLYLKPWNGFHSNMHYLGDAKGNNIYSTSYNNTFYRYSSFAITNVTEGLEDTWNSLYNVITNADYVINDYISIARNYVNAALVNQCEGEARFMRATAYWYLAMYWHDVPIIDEPRDHLQTTSVAPNRFEDVLQYVINDLEYAAANLPEQDEKGRVTRYSAQGMLARAYVTAAAFARGENCSQDMIDRYADYGVGSNIGLAELFYSKAKEVAKDVIENAPQYGLMESYEEIFRVQNNNCKEVLFAVQFVPHVDTWGLVNSTSFAYDREMTNGLNANGQWTFASYDMGRLLLDQGGRCRRRGNIFVDLETYDYIGTHTASHTWTVGYVGGQKDDKRSKMQKFPIKKFTVGSPEDTGGVAVKNNTGFRTPMLRMGEVYLLYVEACMSTNDVITNDDEQAITYFNEVRRRAYSMEIEEDKANINDLDYEKQYEDKPAVSRDDLLKEFRMELFMEGIWWPTLVRRSFYQSDWVVKFANNELMDEDPETDMTSYRWWAYNYDGDTGKISVWNTNQPFHRIEHRKLIVGDYIHSSTANDNIWASPYPENEMVQDKYLSEAPVAYKFNH